jgi:hypothetical protein
VNLFYVSTGSIDNVVDSNLSLGVSPILPSFTDVYSFEGSIIFFEYGGGDGFWIHSGTANPLTYSDSLSLKDSYNEIHVMSAQSSSDVKLYKLSKNGLLSLIDTFPHAKIAYGNGIYCYVYISGTTELTVGKSIDGDSWETITITTIKDTQDPNICFGNNSFIICDGEIYKSEDCTTWTEVYSDSLYWNKIVHTSYGFLILNDTIFLQSSDGITWNTLSLPTISIDNPFTASWNSLIVNEDTLCLSVSNSDLLSELVFSLNGGTSWGNSLTVTSGFIRVFSLSIGKFWTNFIKTTES